MDAKLVIDEEKLQDIKVRVVLDVTLEEAARIERDIAQLGELKGKVEQSISYGWDTQNFVSTLRGLRQKAESAIAGLKFEESVQ